METRFYQARDLDIERIARDVEAIFHAQGYQAQRIGNREQMIVQIRKGGDLEALIGMQAAQTITLRSAPGGIVAAIGEGQWIDKAAIGVMGLFLWPLFLTAGAGVLRQASLESQIVSTLDSIILQHRSDVHIGPVPPHMQGYTQPHPQSQPAPHGKLECSNCHAENDYDDFYCSQCGKPLAVRQQHCPQCHAAVKADAAFCTKCGTTLPASKK
ncbi:double zinc ribbon protein [Thermosporothrix hazakensis]|jgi:predicted RNA-binding Zn-ribbon protein involved in translation (DUF1610 family)|uniref:Double zinc ribbon protein n=1 Tax=Thermosporothrix hazakensis TaxID=644383 RepID=A0A326UCK0_THEHA|nr:zinc ribbon domain-containing protein [Thermosporothrix hazakensis]PZW32009.1 double zinc ribbon protein [Thermosporothrix hazakensis]GCE49664.1 hypothetical protein KTH_45330 [Thermosporothrix hazakensis]